MAIELKECQCGCGRTFHGTSRRRFATDYCRVKWNRAQKKVIEHESTNNK